MAVETGFVIETLSSSSNKEIVAQRQTGYYKSEKNELILESMNIPTNQCYKLILLDSYGDGFCCDMGGGSGTLYLGSDTSYYTGNVLVEVSGTFEFENYGEFCLGSASLPSPLSSSLASGNSSGSDVGTGADSISVMSHSKNTTPPPDPPTPPPVMPPPPPATPPLQQPEQPKESFSSTPLASSSSWSGPVDNPEFEYCTQFCSNGSTSRSMNGMMCGNYECLQTSNVATSDSQEVQYQDHPPPPSSQEETPQEETEPLTSTQFYTENSEYYLTVQIQFDDNPQEVSWVLYDLTTNEVRVFVDFDEYNKIEFANRLLTLKVTMDGPELGEKQYAFTVYDNASNGLCCDHGQGYYEVYLGDVEDDLYLLGDDAFDFSSSYYFTLFEDESHGDDIETTTPPVTSMPSSGPTRAPTTQAPTTMNPTTSPSNPPTSSPTTAKPTEAWEVQRPEDEEAIGARWSTRTKTFPGVFNDIGGDEQHKYKYSMNRSSDIHNAASSPRRDSVTRTCIVTGSLVLMYMFALAVI